MEQICPHDICTGCRVCQANCPVDAITMTENECGHLYPSIDSSKCIDCNKCVRLCPSVNPPVFNREPDECWAVRNCNSKELKLSTSGGVSHLLARAVIERGGVFCGARWDSTGRRVKHECCDSIEKLRDFQGSKYVQSDCSEALREIRDLLNQGREVLFAGTPCQVAAVKKQTPPKLSDRLRCVEIICHGVPSPSMMENWLQYLENSGISSGKVVNYLSREKTPDQYSCSGAYTFSDGHIWRKYYGEDFFFLGFVDNYTLRPNCFKCQYSRLSRVADLTIGDFWGYSPQSLLMRNYRRGTSVVLVNTPAGQRLLESIEPRVVMERRPIIDALNSNRNLSAPQKQPARYNEFWNRYNSGETLADLSPEFFPPKPRSRYRLKKRVTDWIKILTPSFLLQNLIKLKKAIRR